MDVGAKENRYSDDSQIIGFHDARSGANCERMQPEPLTNIILLLCTVQILHGYLKKTLVMQTLLFLIKKKLRTGPNG